MITKEQLNGLNFEKIQERSSELEKFTDYIPILIYSNLKNPQNRWEYLRKQGLYEEGLKQKQHARNSLKKAEDKFEYQINELIEWINKYPEFTDLINIKEL